MKKTSISLTETTLEYINNKAKEIGVNRSAMISFIVDSYKKQEENRIVKVEKNELRK